MILQFNEHDYVDITEIRAMRWFPEKELGIIVFSGERIAVEKEQYDKIEQSFLWHHKVALYGPDYKKVKLVQVKGED